MSDGPRAQGGEAPTSTGAKPSIAEVAAWLRRAAEQREVVEDLGSVPRKDPDPAHEQEPEHEASARSDVEASAGGEAPPAAADLWAAPATLHRGSDTPIALPVPTSEAPPALGGRPSEHPPEPAADMLVVDHEAATAEPEARSAPPADEPPAGGPGVRPPEAAAAAAFSEAHPRSDADADAGADERAGGPGERADRPGDPPPVTATKPAVPDEPDDTEEGAGERPGHGGDDDHDGRAVADGPQGAGSGLRPFVMGGAPAGPAEMTIGTSPGVDEAVDPEAEAEAEAGEEQRLGSLPAATTVAVANGAAAYRSEAASPPADAQRHQAVVDEDEAQETVLDDLAVAPVKAAAGADAPPDAVANDSIDITDAATTTTVEAGDGIDVADRGPGAGSGRAAAPVSLFDLDLADLAARARAAGERDEAEARFEPDRRRRAARTVEDDDPGSPPDPDGSVADAAVAAEQAAPAGTGLTWAHEDSRGGVYGDVVLDDEAEADAEATATEKAPSKANAATAVALANAALARRRARRKRYPRGQLKERIGVLRRVRAMLGVVVLTVILGVAAGAAIGAVLLFMAFALRNAITSG